ncbi:MAG TPA: hypothetical protein VFX47_02960 [Gammaproteobacteria bacterium]|nr:hypothetical protein [Gammaproteobacteria bacterium]
MRTIEIPLQAGEVYEFSWPNMRYMQILVSAAALDFTVFGPTGEEEHSGALEGDYIVSYQGMPSFDRIRFLSAAAQNITIGVSRRAGGERAITGQVTVTPGDTLATVADTDIVAAAAAALVLPANTGRKTAVIINLTTSAGEIRIGDENAAAARGIPCAVGGSVSLDTSAAIYVYSTTGATVALTEVV